MSQLIHIRQRIKAIETIKKITHAMRLISMSSHSRLGKQQKNLSTYQSAIDHLLAKLQPFSLNWHNSLMHPAQSSIPNPLIILIGSHKGLCGTFNNALFNYTADFLEKKSYEKATIFCIGNKAINFISANYPRYHNKSFTHCSAHTFLAIADEIVKEITHTTTPFSSVVIISNKMKSFFIQKPEITTLIPFTPPQNTKSLPEDFVWEHNPEQVLDRIATMYVESKLQYLLFESLLAEHAARFISMDSSTRNADTILESTKLMYNKLRQAKITKELTELSGSF